MFRCLLLDKVVKSDANKPELRVSKDEQVYFFFLNISYITIIFVLICMYNVIDLVSMT